jgi:nitroreductase
MDLIDAIYARRAVRSYLPETIDEASIRQLLSAATQAPSAMNAQPWAFAVVQDKARLERYSQRAKSLILAKTANEPKAERYRTMLSDPNFNIFYDAGTLIAICADPRSAYAQADCWLAAQNLQLAAVARGLGTCCIGFALGVLNEAEVKTELGIPQSSSAIAALIVGKPRMQPPAVVRKEPVVLSWLR